MNKKLNKKLLNLIALCSGITATVAVGIGGIVYSIQEKNSGGGDEPVDQKVLPEEVYKFSEDGKTLLGFQDAFLNDSASPIYKDNFKDCDTMQIPARVTSINECAFYNGSESTIPDFIENLTFAEESKCSSIGNRAFVNCSSLISIILSNSLFTIEYSAFADCSSLTTIDFSKATNLNSIGDSAFYSCSQLTSVDLSNCTVLSSMGSSIFYSCSSLTSIKLPSSIDEIPDAAFGNCSALSSIDLSHYDKLSLINGCAFEYCSALTSVSFPESLNEIGNSAFWHCPSLRSINFPNNLFSIGNSAFCDCSSLTSVTFPSSLESIGMFAFGECSNLSSITWDRWKGDTILPDDHQFLPFLNVSSTGTVTVTNPSGHDSDELLQYLLDNGGLPQTWAKNVGPELPDSVYDIDETTKTLKGFKSGIDWSQYQNTCDTMKIPAKVRSIKDEAFYANYSSTIPSFIKNLTFAENSNCSAIGEYAFGYSSLTSVDLSNSKSYGIYDSVFTNCSSLTSVILPNSIGIIGSDAFYNCRSLTSVDFSKATILGSINSSAFYNCESLTSVDLSNTNLSTIGQGAFWDCTKLDTIIFPNTLTSIKGKAFIYCSSLTSIDLSNCNQLTTINNGTFSECRSLTSVSFPSSLNQMARAFNNCSNLSSITWDAWNGNITLIESTPFSGVCPDGGTVTVTNPSDGHDSDALLDYLLKNGGLPQSWAKVNPLPEEVYNIDTNNVLLGFTTEFLANPTAYDMYNTMEIPARVTSIGNLAFWDYADSSSRIPSFITRLTFEENSNCGSIGNNTFQNCSSLTSVNLLNCQNLSSINNSAFSFCSALTSVSFPSSLIEIRSIFNNCPNLSSITWDRWTGSFDFLASDAFSGVCQTSGTVTVINPIDDAHNSAALLAYLKQNSELLESWIVA